MESTLESFPTMPPSVNSQPKKSLSALSSIENRGEITERKLTNNVKTDVLKFHNLGPHTSESTTKRYCISQDVKDKFYAIRHIQRSNMENEPSTHEDNENMDPSKTPVPNKKINNRGRKRIAPDNNPHQTIFTPIISNTPQPELMKRKKSRQQNKPKKEHYSLYQTCHQIWPESSTLGDLSNDHIKSLGDLLKIRLNQAKFKMMARLDKDNDLFSILAEEYVPPKPRPPFTLQLNKVRNSSTLSVVGNGKHLFTRQQNKSQRRHSLTMATIMESIFDTPTSPNDDKTTSPQRNSKTPKDRKKKMPKTTVLKTKRVTTPKRRSAAADVVPVVLSDGSSVYVCEPCNKKYKNRNGLAYHMERCKNTVKPAVNDEKPSSQPENNSNIDCICSQSSDENASMIQCEKCHNWLHSDCVGLSEDTSEETFCCSKCKNQPELSETKKVEQDLLQCLLEAQASEERMASSTQASYPIPTLSQQQQDQLNQLKELLSQPVIQQQEEAVLQNEEDELFSMPTTNADDEPAELDSHAQSDNFDAVNDSSQLHIWDDFNVNSGYDKTNNTDQWNLMEEEEPFSSYDTDIQSSTWNMSDLNIFNQPPSLLFTENTMDSALDDDSIPLIGDLATSMPISEPTSACGVSPIKEATPQNSEGLWFQFANFDNDYHCDNDKSLK